MEGQPLYLKECKHKYCGGLGIALSKKIKGVAVFIEPGYKFLSFSEINSITGGVYDFN